jgi:hypothetical protein
MRLLQQLLQARLGQALVVKHRRQAGGSMCLCSAVLLLLGSSCSAKVLSSRLLLLLVLLLALLRSVPECSLLQRPGRAMLLLLPPLPAFHVKEAQQPGRMRRQRASASSSKSPAVQQAVHA